MGKTTKNSDASFIMQGSILAIASIISRIVGLLYRIPLTAIIGKTGNDYYGTAFEVYSIILIISSYSIPLAVSKIVSARMSKGRAKDTFKILKGSLLFAFISGGLGAIIVYFGAEFFTGSLLHTPLSTIALKILAPTILIVAILGVFRGFFQGLHTMVPSAISQIIEQIINAIISIVAAYYLFSYGKKVGAVLNNEGAYAASYGAAGGTLGTASGALGGLLFILVIFLIFRPHFMKEVKNDRHRSDENLGSIMKLLILTIVPVLLSTTIYNISSIIDQGIFKNIAVLQGYTAQQISEWWGVFTGQYKVLINVPISIASALAASVVPSLTQAYHKEDTKAVKNRIRIANKFIMMVAFPSAVGLAVLSKPIMELLFNDIEKSSYLMLTLGSVSVIFYSLSTLSNGLLQGVDKMKVPVRNAAIALVLHVLVLIALLEMFKLNIFAVIFANAFYALCMCFLNETSLRRYTGARIDIYQTIVAPLISSIVMGVIVFAVYKFCMYFFGFVIIALAISVILGVLSYFAVLILLRGVDRKTLEQFPKGHIIINVAEKLHLM